MHYSPLHYSLNLTQNVLHPPSHLPSPSYPARQGQGSTKCPLGSPFHQLSISPFLHFTQWFCILDVTARCQQPSYMQKGAQDSMPSPSPLAWPSQSSPLPFCFSPSVRAICEVRAARVSSNPDNNKGQGQLGTRVVLSARLHDACALTSSCIRVNVFRTPRISVIDTRTSPMVPEGPRCSHHQQQHFG